MKLNLKPITVCVFLLIILSSQIGTSFLIQKAGAEGPLQEELEEKLIRLAYEMAKNRKFIEYFFIPGIGFGNQQLKGGGQLYAVLILLPAIYDKEYTSTSVLLGKVLESSIKGAIDGIKNGPQGFVNGLFSSIGESLKNTMGNIVSFYFPYQRIIFRVIAIVFIKSRSLTETLFDSLTKNILSASFNMFEQLVNSALNQLDRNISSEIRTMSEKLKKHISDPNRIDNYIDYIHYPIIPLIPIPVLDDKGNIIKMNYGVTVIGEVRCDKILEDFKMILNYVKDINNYFKNGYKDIITKDIDEGVSGIHDDSNDKEERKEIYRSQYEDLRNVLISKVEEFRDNLPIPSITSVIEYSVVESMDEVSSEIERLRSRIRDELKKKIDDAIDSMSNKAIKEISDFLNDIRNTLGKTLEDIASKAGKFVSEVGSAAVSNLATKIPLVNAVYMAAEFIHAAFTNILTAFAYKVSPPKGTLEIREGRVDYCNEVFEPEKEISLGVGSAVQGIIKALFAVGAEFICGDQSIADFIPQILTFDIDFEGKLVCGGEPGIYRFDGSIFFKNMYSKISDFLNDVKKAITGKQKGFSIFETSVNNKVGTTTEVAEKTDSKVSFAIPYIIASAIPVVENVKIDDYSIKAKIAAILDVGSIIRMRIKELKQKLVELRQRVKQAAYNIVDEVTNIVEGIIENIIDSALGSVFGQIKAKIADSIDSFLGISIDEILKPLFEYAEDFLKNKIKQLLLTPIISELKETINKLVESAIGKILDRVQFSMEECVSFLSIIGSCISIPLRCTNNVSIYVLSLNRIIKIDSNGYCEIEIGKNELAKFSNPISPMESYVVLNSREILGMVPYSTFSYEPLVVQTFSEISSSNSFIVRPLIEPDNRLKALRVTSEDTPVGTRLVFTSEGGLRFIPNPYPYGEVYVDLKLPQQ